MLQDVASFEETQETLALLKLLAIGNREVEEGRTSSSPGFPSAAPTRRNR